MKKFLALALALMMVLALCACGDKAEEAAEVVVDEAPAVEAAPAVDAAPAEEGDASGEMGDASGEMGDASGEMGGMGNQDTDFEITVDGVTGTAHYADVDSGDQATKTFVITWDGKDINGAIDKGVWTATSGDAAEQAVVDAVQAAFENSNGGAVGPSEEPAA